MKMNVANPSLPTNGVQKPIFSKSIQPLVGAATWTERGEWINTTSKKIRLMVGNNPQSFIALEENGNKGFYQRIRDFFTHVSIFQNGQIFSLNIGSLCKRTQLSVAMILLLKLRGKLNLDYIEKSLTKAEEKNRKFEHIIETGRKEAIARKENPDAKAEELKEVVQTVLKSRRLAKGVMAQRGERLYIGHQDDKERFSLFEFSPTLKRDFLGKGTYGLVFRVHNLVTGALLAFKVAKEQEFKESIVNEYEILNRVHKNGPITGIQETPHFILDLLQPIEYQLDGKVHKLQNCEGYIATIYDHNLFDLNYLKNTPLKDKILDSSTLFEGLNWLHKNEIIHCDIKPANCCSQNGLRIADFGHVRESNKITPDQPLGVCTAYFTCDTDLEENRRIIRLYFLNELAMGRIKTPAAKFRILHSAINQPILKGDIQAAKYSIAHLLLKFSDKKLMELKSKIAQADANKAALLKKELEDFTKKLALYKTEMDELKKNPDLIWSKQLNLAKFKLTENQVTQLQKESVALCKRHDVYGLAISLLCIYLGVQCIQPHSIPAALKKFSNDPDLALVKPELTNLLERMLDKKGANRPSIQEASDLFSQIVKKI